MRSAVFVPRSRRTCHVARAVALMVLFSAARADAGAVQSDSSSDSKGPPIAISGFRYALDRYKIHHFICEQAACGPGSHVSYELYPPNVAMNSEQFRRQQEMAVKMLEGRAPGTKITLLGIEQSGKKDLVKVFKARRVNAAPDGSKEYVISSIIIGSKFSSSLISSSRDEEVNGRNYNLFAAGLMIAGNLNAAAKRRSETLSSESCDSQLWSSFGSLR
jgi:hypothetical protein